MIVTTKQVVNIEMDNTDFDALLHTLDEASKVRSKLFPLMNQRATILRDSLTEGRGAAVWTEVSIETGGDNVAPND